MEKGTPCILKVLSTQDVYPDVRANKDILKGMKEGDILKAQYELSASATSEDCFWVDKYFCYIYFPKGSVQIIE